MINLNKNRIVSIFAGLLFALLIVSPTFAKTAPRANEIEKSVTDTTDDAIDQAIKDGILSINKGDLISVSIAGKNGTFVQEVSAKELKQVVGELALAKVNSIVDTKALNKNKSISVSVDVADAESDNLSTDTIQTNIVIIIVVEITVIDHGDHIHVEVNIRIDVYY